MTRPEDMDDEERVALIRTISSMALNAELSGTELEFYNHLIKFFEDLATKHYNRGYAAAVREMSTRDGGRSQT